MFTPFLTGYFIDCCEPFTDSLSLSILQVSVPFPVSWSSNIWTNKYSLVNFFIMFDWRLCLFVIRIDDAIFHCLPCCLIGLVENRFMLSYSVTDWYLPTLEGVSFREGLGPQPIVSSEVHMECLAPIGIKPLAPGCGPGSSLSRSFLLYQKETCCTCTSVFSGLLMVKPKKCLKFI